MSMLKCLAALLVAASSALAIGCAPPGTDIDTSVEDTTESEDAAVAFQVLDVQKSDSPPGLVVIKSKAAYQEFFGEAPPAGVKFNAHWVLHYSMGVQGTGGYGTEIVSIEKNGAGADRALVVTTADTHPGYGCQVTQALTNPQLTVRINKHSGAQVEHVGEYVQNDCVVQDFCPVVRCNMGTTCNEELNECSPNLCDPERNDECGPGLACQNLIRCVTTPCPEEFRCHQAPTDPCMGYDYNGACEGQNARWCEDQELKTVECEECFVDDAGFADCR